MAAAAIERETARASLASWFGLAKHAHVFRLSRSIFGQRDVDHLGKRLLVKSLYANRSGGARRAPASGRDGA